MAALIAEPQPLPDFNVVPHCGHWSPPRVIAALAGFVHDRQSTAG